MRAHNLTSCIRMTAQALVLASVLAAPSAGIEPICPKWSDYVPEIRYSTGTFFAIPKPTKATYNGTWVEDNWEAWSGEEPLHMTVHVMWDHIENFPGNRVLVFQYYFYYPRNQQTAIPLPCAGDITVDHEHDWEWVCVVMAPTSSGVVPYAITASSHDSDNQACYNARYFPGTNRSPLVEVVDDTHPVVYIVDRGNAFDFTGAWDANVAWTDLVSAGDQAGATISYNSCDTTVETVRANGTIAFGIEDGTLQCECRDVRFMPWNRVGCWYDPFTDGQISYSGVGWIDNMSCGGCWDCSWSELRAMWGPLALSYSADGPLWRGRPQGVFTSASAQRIIWSHWSPELASYRVGVGEGGGEVLMPVQADSEAVIASFGGATKSYGVRGLESGSEVRHLPGREGRILGVASASIEHSLTLLRAIRGYGTLDVNRLLGISDDGWLIAYDTTNLASPTVIGSYDLRDWGLWDDYSSLARELAAEWMLFGSSRNRLVIALACPGKGVALLDGTDFSDITYDQLIPVVARDVTLMSMPSEASNRLLSASGSQGLRLYQVTWGINGLSANELAVFLPADFPGSEAEKVGKLTESSVAAAFVKTGPSDDAFLYQVACSGSELSPGWRLGPPDDWPYTTMDPVWNLDDVDANQQLATTHDVTSQYFAHLDLTTNPPSYITAGRNGLFNGPMHVGSGRYSLCLPHRHFLRMGSTPVRYGLEIRFWGGLELYQYEPYRELQPVGYVGGVAEEGFVDAQHLDVSPRALDRFERDDKEYIVVSAENAIPVWPWGRQPRLVFYRLADDFQTVSVDEEHSGERDASVGVEWREKPYANPSNRAIRFALYIGDVARIGIEVYDVGGRKVRTIADGRVMPGIQEYVWDGRSDRGNRVASGVYFLRIVGPKTRLTSQMVIVR